MRNSSMIIMGAVAALIALPAFAQAPDGTPTRIRGTVEKLDGQVLTVKSRDGQPVQIMLAPDAGVLGIKKIKLADIKQGDFIGTAAAPGKDGKLHAEEVLVFPEAARGTGEGHYPWDLKGGNETMTNATVAEVASAPKGRVLKLTYKGGAQEVVVDPKTPIVTFAPDQKSLLKKGAHVFVPALKKADGTIVASRVIAEKNHVRPPM
jgi:uncharacterized protein DUF5666